ncbi:MAG TPA: hypothetical protein VHM30_13620 [Gemmatimonadaceae bacterium]|nr:hypothetical protein [Gemmatimonadaceae bacterium]
MLRVRPDGRTALALLALVAACATRERAADTGAAKPSPYVSEIPPWPSDTSAMATSHGGAFSAALRAKVPSCGATTPVVAPDAVGPLYPGQPLPLVLGACPERLLIWDWDDGAYLPAIAVRLGEALVVADLAGITADDVVSRVVVLDGARTAEGIGPGSSLADLQHAYGTPIWRRNQCSVGVSFESRPGLLARIALPEEGSDAWTCDEIRRLARGETFAQFPHGSRVRWIGAELGGAS